MADPLDPFEYEGREEPGSLLPGFKPVPHRLNLEGQQVVDPNWQPEAPPQGGTPLAQSMPDIIAGMMTADQRLAAEYLKTFDEPQPAVGKRGAADQGLGFYSKVPGTVELVNGEWWLYDQENQETPWRRYTAHHVYDPQTGQVYEEKDAGQPQVPLAGTVEEIGPRAAQVARDVATDTLTIFGRWAERARLGLVAPEFVNRRDAMAVAGAVASGHIGRGAVARGAAPEPAPPRGAVPSQTVTRADLDRLGIAELPPRRPVVEAPPVPVEAPAAAPPQYRVRPGGVRPTGHTTTAEVARAAEARRARIEAERPELDEAGFYVNALERGKRELPEQATAQEMREALVEMGVNQAEASMLGLDRMLMGEVGVARAQLREAEQQMGRLASAYGRALNLSRRLPGNTGYRENAVNALAALRQAQQALPEVRQAVQAAERSHMQEAIATFRQAEAQLKKINENIRGARKQGEDITPLLEERQQARQYLEKSRNELEQARSGDPSLRMVTREDVLKHIRENRPRTDLYIREYPAQRYGAMTEPIERITGAPDMPIPNHFRDALIRRGVARETAQNIQEGLRASPVTEWGQYASALGSHMRQSGIVREALEEAAGAPLNRMVDAYRGRSPDVAAADPPRYKQSVPDKENPTLQEIAVTLQGPWDVRRDLRRRVSEQQVRVRAALDAYHADARRNTGRELGDTPTIDAYNAEVKKLDDLTAEMNAAPKPPFTTGHWPGGDKAPIGHMQVTMQRASAPLEHALQGQAERAGIRLDVLQRRKAEIEQQLAHDENMPEAQSDMLTRELRDAEREIAQVQANMPKPKPSDDKIYMGNQFQSDWAGSGIEGFQSSNTGRQMAAIDQRSRALRDQIAVLNDRIAQIENRAPDYHSLRQVRRGDVVQAHYQEIDILGEELAALNTQRNKLENLPEYHALVASQRAWLRPVLEQFVDRGIQSGARYLGVPDGATVSAHNYIGPGTVRFYDEMLRPELRYVMERRGLPYSETTTRTMHGPVRDDALPGTWFLIEIPKNARGGRGMRLMARGGPAAPQPDEEVEDGQ